MSNAAVQLEQERKKRVEAAERQEAENLELDHVGRERSGNKADFLFEVNRTAREQNIEARLRAGRGNLILDID